MRLIDADALKKAICEDQCEKDGCDYTCSEIAYVCDAPTVELTDEAAIEHLQASGWMQNHDREMTRVPWVSVDERLPEEAGRYLCFLGNHPFGGFVKEATFNAKEKEFWWYEYNKPVPFITHWAPMPEFPKEDDGK